VQAKLPHWYGKVNILAECCGVELYTHAFITTAVDRDLFLTSTPHRFLLDDKRRVRPESSVWLENQNGRFGEETGLLYNVGKRSTFVQTVG